MTLEYKDARNLDANGKPTVATMSPAFAALEKKRQLSRALLGGTTEMIRAGKTWLPQHPGESDGNYKVRLESNVLVNFLERAVSKAATRIMAKPIALDGVPPELEKLLEDIDLQGRDLNAFAMDVLKQAFADGIAYILADQPQANGVKTVADAKAAGIRPYAVIVPACCLLDVVSELIRGERVITKVRIMECVQVKDGKWGYSDKEQVRVLIRQPNGTVTFELWEEKEDSTTVKKEWVMVGEGATGMQRIALVPVYTNRTGYMEGEPPFQATAELNLDHWRVRSERRNALTMNCFEMLAATGVDDKWVAEVGPAKVQISSNEQAKFYYLSPSGSGVELSTSYLKDIEENIDSASASFRVENAGKVTATAAALDSEESAAGLKAVAEAFSDALELLFGYMAEMIGIPPENTGDVTVNTDYGSRKGSDTGLQELGKARERGDMSQEEWVATMKWRGELAPDVEVKGGEPPKSLSHVGTTATAAALD